MMDLFTLQAALSFAPPTGDQPRRFRMTAYDGGLLSLPGIPMPVVVDLKGMQSADQVKALLFHDPALPVGHMDQVRIGDAITTEGVLSVPENAGRIEAAQKNGFAWEASIGATIVGNAKELVPAGQTVAVNGRTFRGPLMVARKTMLREVSFVGVGAGQNTSSRIAAQAIPFTPDQLMPADAGTESNKTPETPAQPQVSQELAEIRELKASYAADREGLKADREALKAEREALQRERLADAVDRINAQYGSQAPAELLTELRDKAKAGSTNEGDIELQILRAAGQHRLEAMQPWGQQKGAPATPHLIEAALQLNLGWGEDELAKHFDEKTINAALSSKFNGFGLHSLGVEYLRAQGHHVLGGKLQDEDIRAMISLAEAEPIRASGGFSTFSLPGILSNVARKEAVRAYDSFQKAILTIAKISNATDYKPYYMYRLNTDGLLLQVGADGELKSMELKEDSYQARVFPWGRKLAINSVMWINDDAGFFTDLARQFGLLGARTVERQGFKTLLANQSTFWTTAKGNRLASGAGSALSIDSLGSAYQLFLQQKDSTGEPIGMLPKYACVAPGDFVDAGKIYSDTYVNLAAAGDTDTVVERTNGNPYKGMFQPLQSPYLADGFEGANGTQWLLTADPAIAAPIVAAFLNGKKTPQIRPWEALPGKMGMQWDITLSFGFSPHDDKGSVYSPGQ